MIGVHIDLVEIMFTKEGVGAFNNRYYILLVLPIVLGILAIAPQAFAATAQITIPAGSGADQSCVAAKTCFSPNVLNIAPGDTVTWTNADKLGHTATSGKPTDNQTGTVWDSSLIKAGGTYSFTFQNAGTYNYFCMVHPWMTGEIVVGASSQQSISVTTDKSSYQAGDLVTITVQSSSLPAGQALAVMIDDPSANIITSRTLTISSLSSSTLQLRLPQNAQIGTYNIVATAFVSGTLFKGTAQFSVTSTNPPSEVSIVSVQPTNQQGNPVSSFGKGTTGFAKVVLSSQTNQISLVTVNLVGADSTSLGVGIIKMTLNSGQTEIELSFYIPPSAAGGTGTIYADVYSDWPSNGGIPLTTESSTVVGIG